MTPIPLVRAAAVAPLAAFLERAGEPVAAGLERARLCPRMLADPEAVLPLHLACAAIEQRSQALGIEDLGARVGAATPLTALGRYGVAIVEAPTLLAAIRRAERARAELCSGEDVWLVREPARAWLRFRFDRRIACGRSEIEPYTVMLAVQLVRLAAGAGWKPLAVELGDVSEGALASLAPLDVPIRRGAPSIGVALEPHWLQRPLRPALATARDLDAEATPRRLATGFAGTLRQVVETLLLAGRTDTQSTADATGMSLRTMQRWLARAGTSHATLLDEVRCGIAMRLLADRTIPVTEIALRLHYADPSNFSHAFRRWTGASPRGFRDEMTRAS